MYRIFINDRLNEIDIEASLPLLSDQRRQQALAYRHEQGRRECIAAYLLLCQALREVYGITTLPIFEYSEHDKPSIVGHPEIFFNLSHCKEAAICVVSDQAIGVDIESIREYDEAIAQYSMSDEELFQIQQSSHSDLAFIRLWTMKEAFVKLSGRGLPSQLHLQSLLSDIPSSRFITHISPDRRYLYTLCLPD
jgi:4'-phosphopantetheinyl transferase